MPRVRLLIAILGLIAIVTPAAATPAFEAMAEAGAAYVNDTTRCPGIISAATLFDNLDDFTVIDIRAESDYVAGHIPGAYNSSLSTLLDDLATAIPSHRPYAVACYTGQTAGHAKIAMELMGYADVRSLNFGMASWHRSLGSPWNANVGDFLANPETANQNGDLVVHPFPVLDGDPATIVAERVAFMLAQGFRSVSYLSIQDNLDDYFIINYFGQADYEGNGTSGVPGHVPGAFQFTPYQSLGIDQMLANIPVDMPVVVYGWTGQHSSQLVAYLNMLGYEAYVLRFGANNLFYSDLLAHRWNPAAVVDLPLETGGGPLAAPGVAAAPVAGLANYPNPFNPATTITYRLAESASVTLRIYDLSGRLVRGLLAGDAQAAGTHEVSWQGRDDAGRAVPSGTYLCLVDAGGFVVGRRMALLK